MKQEEAIAAIVEALRKPGEPMGHASYGYDLYMPKLLYELYGVSDNRAEDLAPAFFDAAWELCRRGVLRPGVHRLNAQAPDHSTAGCGFSITPFGRQWLEEGQSDLFVPTEPERFGQMLSKYTRFGPDFRERGQEAIRCYGANAYLACCTMCGAAAESILLSVAIAKRKGEDYVLKTYEGAKGRINIQNLVIGQAAESLKREFAAITGLLKYWQDEPAPGTASQISENEAFTSLVLLLRSAMFADCNWDTLVSDG